MRSFLVLTGVIVIAYVVTKPLWWGEARAWWYRDYSEVRTVANSNWFDYPIGAPNAKGYYRAQRFCEGSTHHLGEDWNGMGGGNSDYGDPVYSIADGTVTYADDIGGGWGKVVRIVHPVNTHDSIEAVYAHLAEMKVVKGDRVRRGEVIGTIGDADGSYQAHLHFEIRNKVGMPLGAGYGDPEDYGYCDPSDFIDKHREKN